MAGNLLGGTRGTAYTGTKANQPPNFTFHSRVPNQYDTADFEIGDEWYVANRNIAEYKNIYKLVSLDGNAQNTVLATWALMVSGVDDLNRLTASDATFAIPTAGNITFPAGHNIFSTAAGSNFTVNVTNTMVLGDLAPVLAGTTLVVNTSDSEAIRCINADPDIANNACRFRLARNIAGGPVQNTSGIGNIIMEGLDGAAGYQQSAAMRSICSAAVVNGVSIPSLLEFRVGDGINVTAPQRMTINQNGQVVINAPASGDALTVTGNIAMPATNMAGSQGILKIAGNGFIQAYGTANTFVGNAAGNMTLTTASATSNTGLGNATLQGLTTGANNTAIGATCLIADTTGSNNTAVGIGSMTMNISGSANTAVGSGSLSASLTGTVNAVFGLDAGSNYTGAESNNLLLLNDGVLGESNTIRVGDDGGGLGQQNRCFIAGIRGATTGVADAVAVLIDSAGQLGTVSSSIKYKDNVKDMGDESNILMKLRPVVFNYKAHPNVPAWGLIAEEVEEVFPQLVVYKHGEVETVKYHEIVPLMLNEIQKLNRRILELEKSKDIS